MMASSDIARQAMERWVIADAVVASENKLRCGGAIAAAGRAWRTSAWREADRWVVRDGGGKSRKGLEAGEETRVWEELELKSRPAASI